MKHCILGLTSTLLTSITTSAVAETSKSCPGESGYYNTNYRASQNPKKGGFVSNSAFVDDRAFIAPTAAVCGSATVEDSARVYGNAVIRDEAEVSGDARVYGDAIVSGTAQIRDDAKVSGNAQVKGDAIIEGTSWIQGYTVVSSGVHSDGVSKSQKPQSLIDSENQAKLADQKRKAAELKAQKQAEYASQRLKSQQSIIRDLEKGGWVDEDTQRSQIDHCQLRRHTAPSGNM